MPTRDAVGPSASGATLATGSTKTLTWTHVCGSSATMLVVGIALGASTSPQNSATFTSVTYNGVAMTAFPKVQSNSPATTDGYIQQFYLLNPATGSHSVTANLSAAVAGLSAGSVSFTSATGVGTPQVSQGYPNSTATETITVPGTTAGNMVVAAACSGSNGMATVSPATVCWARYTNGSSGAGAGIQETTPALAGSTPIAFSVPSDYYGMTAVEVQGSAAAVAIDTAQFLPFF